tara:strand:- start:552 stop:836 length:285 start_codon:yes stop_codon:yes gene_type:complete
MAMKKQPSIRKGTSQTTNHYGETSVDYLSRTTGEESDKVANKMDTGGKEAKSGVGASGSMRIVNDGEFVYLELKTKQGWARSDNTSASGFSFKK